MWWIDSCTYCQDGLNVAWILISGISPSHYEFYSCLSKIPWHTNLISIVVGLLSITVKVLSDPIFKYINDYLYLQLFTASTSSVQIDSSFSFSLLPYIVPKNSFIQLSIMYLMSYQHIEGIQSNHIHHPKQPLLGCYINSKWLYYACITVKTCFPYYNMLYMITYNNINKLNTAWVIPKTTYFHMCTAK